MGESFHFLERTRLDTKMERIKEVPLTLITAPMGYGKSAIMWKYLQQNNMQNVWISLGQSHVQEQLLWNHIAHDIAKISKVVSLQMLQITLSHDSNWGITQSQLLTTLRNESASKDFYIILDDYQSCNGDKFNRFLTNLAYEDIPGIHIVIISRQTINLPLEELRLKGYCNVINQADLIMSPTEMKELFILNGMTLDDQQFQKVYAYTDGWVAAARLLWNDYMDTGNIQSFGSIQSLLKESLYMKLSSEEKQLLNPFTCFAELSVEELSAILNQTVTDSILQQLANKLGFFHYNGQNQKYVIHTLLHNIILEENDIISQELYYRNACYQEKQGQLIKAIEYYDKANRREEILNILDGEQRFEIMEQIPEFLLTFFKNCPDSQELIQHPYATLSYIYYLLISVDEELLAEGIRFFSYIKGCYELLASVSDESRNLLGEFYFLAALNVFNDLEAAKKNLQTAWELRGGRASRIFFKRPYSYGVPSTLSMYHKEPGMLKKEVDAEIGYSHEYMKLIFNTDTSLEKTITAEYALVVGEVTLAHERAIESLERALFRNQPCIIISSYLVLLRSIIFLGNRQDFEITMENCQKYMQSVNQSLSLISTEYDLMCGYLYGVLDQLEKIPIWLRNRQFGDCNIIIRGSRNVCIAHGLYLCRKKNWTLLAANAEEMILSFTGIRHVFSEIYAYLFYSITFWYTNEPKKAVKYFLDCVNLAKPDKILMPFAELSEELLPIMELAKDEDSFIDDIISFSNQWQKGIQAFKDKECKEAIFSPREQEVMELLVQGYRNSEIGAKMNIAQITVEKNLTNIYRKIGVTNRTSAVNWYNNQKKHLG